MLHAYSVVLHQHGIHLNDLMQEDPFEAVDRIGNVYDLSEWFRGKTVQVTDGLKRHKQGLYRKEIEKVIRYIKNNLSKNISLAEAAGIANLNEKYFCHVFKKETQKSFTEFVAELKVEQAKRLLGEKGAKVFEVAHQLGFENETYFTKVFKKFTSLTPSEYKRKIV